MARINQTPFRIQISGLTHDGRGVGRREDGKAIFVADALPGEEVVAQQTGRSRHYDEAKTLEVITPSSDRVEPRCEHFGVCSGCVLQHMDPDKQILAKEEVLKDNLKRIGHVDAQTFMPPLVDSLWGYRRKGRFSVRRVEKKGKTLVGFRERDARFVAELRKCHTVIPEIGDHVHALAQLVDSMQTRHAIPQIEFIAGDEGVVVLVFRHLEPLPESDLAALKIFAEEFGFTIYLQPGGLDSVHPLLEHAPVLKFRLEAYAVDLHFRPLDFIQVNAGLNEKMIAKALQLLDVQDDDRILDLFCGLGNFTLPIARTAREVVGVEGDAGLVARARQNAEINQLANAHFYAADLTKDQSNAPWMRAGFSKLLLDPPRSGAIDVLKQLPLDQFQRIVYVSCHPGSLARDAGYLVNERGWTLKTAGVMDMFPHTAHVESIALFERE